MRVSGLTIIKASLQLKNRDHNTKERRALAVSLRWNLVFLVEHQLLVQKQYLGTQGSPGRKRQPEELDALDDYCNKDKEKRSKQLHGP